MNTKIWIVQVERQEDQIVANKKLIDLQRLIDYLKNKEIKEMAIWVQVQKGIGIKGDIIALGGEKPFGLKTLIGENEEILWLNIGFQKTKSNSFEPPEEESEELEKRENLMTEKQRRLLFRLLAERGITGKSAISYLKKALNTDDLRKARKERASKIIDFLKNKGGEDEGSY